MGKFLAIVGVHLLEVQAELELLNLFIPNMMLLAS